MSVKTAIKPQKQNDLTQVCAQVVLKPNIEMIALKISSGISESGEFKSTLYKNGNINPRYYVYIERTDGKEQNFDLGHGVIVNVPRMEEIERTDWLLWHESHKKNPI